MEDAGGGARERKKRPRGQDPGSIRRPSPCVQPEELSNIRLFEEVEWAVRSLVTLRDVVERTFASFSEIRCL